jgi:hypothetical protein
MHNGLLFSHKEEQNHFFCGKMDETGGHYVEGNKSNLKGQISHFHSYMESRPKVILIIIMRPECKKESVWVGAISREKRGKQESTGG